MKFQNFKFLKNIKIFIDIENLGDIIFNNIVLRWKLIKVIYKLRTVWRIKL